MYNLNESDMIQIPGMIHFTSHIDQDGVQSVVTLSGNGTIKKNKQETVLLFEPQQVDSPSPILIHYDERHAIIVKDGNRLEFYKDQVTTSQYKTPYGELPISLHTKEYRVLENGLNLTYQLWFQNKENGQFNVIITYKGVVA